MVCSFLGWACRGSGGSGLGNVIACDECVFSHDALLCYDYLQIEVVGTLG